MIKQTCGGLSDITINLGAGYFYLGEGGDDNRIVFDHKSLDLQSAGNLKVIIYPNVLQFSYDSEFVIVYQKPSYESNIGTIMTERGFAVFYNETQLRNNQAKADSVLRNDPFFIKMFQEIENYYIIDKLNQKTFGPFTLAEFASTKDSLNITLDFDE